MKDKGDTKKLFSNQNQTAADVFTRSRDGKMEIIDWEEEICCSAHNEKMRVEVRTPGNVKLFIYNHRLVSWSIQQGEVLHTYHLWKDEHPCRYTKTVRGREVLRFEAENPDNLTIRKDGRVLLKAPNGQNKWVQMPLIPEEAKQFLYY